MEYGYGFDEESPRFQLGSLWFLLGVIVFAVTVLVMAQITDGAGSSGAYLIDAPREQSGPKPVAPVNYRNRPASIDHSTK